MRHRRYTPGDRVVFQKSKHSRQPGPRARLVSPSRYGDNYAYHVKKFWIVVDVEGDQVTVQTRRGKRHVLDASSPNLKRAGLWDSLFNRHRFPQPTPGGSP